MPKVIITPKVLGEDRESRVFGLAEAIHKKHLEPEILFQETDGSCKIAATLRDFLKRLNETTAAEIKTTNLFSKGIEEISQYLRNIALQSLMSEVPLDSRTNSLVLITSQEIARIFPSYFAMKILNFEAGVIPLEEGQAAYFNFRKSFSMYESYLGECSILP